MNTLLMITGLAILPMWLCWRRKRQNRRPPILPSERRIVCTVTGPAARLPTSPEEAARWKEQAARSERLVNAYVDHDIYMRFERGPYMARTRTFRKAHKTEIDAAKLAVIVARKASRRAYRNGTHGGNYAALRTAVAEAEANLAKWVEPCKS